MVCPVCLAAPKSGWCILERWRCYRVFVLTANLLTINRNHSGGDKSHTAAFVGLTCAPPPQPFIWALVIICAMLEQWQWSALNTIVSGDSKVNIGDTTLGQVAAAQLKGRSSHSIAPSVCAGPGSSG